MRKLVIITTVPLTINAFLKDQVLFLSEYFEVTLVSSGELDDVDDFKDVGVEYINIRMVRAIDPMSDLKSIYNLARLFAKVKPDIVHSYTPKAGLVSMIAAYITRVPNRFHTFTGLIFPTLKGLRKEIFKLVDRIICFCATKPIPEGEGVKDDLLSERITSKYIEVVGNGNIAGVDTSYFSRNQFLNDVENGVATIAYNKVSPSEFVFSYVGRYTNDKGLRELIDAFSEMSSNCILLLAGEPDLREPLSSEYMNKIKANKNIIEYGWINDVRGVLFSSDIFILPSYREGFPNTPLQASALEVPSIVTDVNGSNEIISEGLNGYIVAPQSKNSLLKAMLYVFENKEELPSMGGAARKRVLTRFERKNHHSNLLSLYNGVIK
ncbi:glycosyltransferase family 4 protein [Pseudoalteromonas prydzensis]|uniref:glycosyltransferase family 4 protein n=1 Tax=Pseudoalteromonas prydzensis TaxID=182141 RepID=UPI0007E4E86C|nr:glycosyltransferase family 4 protein [Pseudoalteromonas prydzensis]MBE0376689.1 hypothetical protein [Pseudoalteromonas prydzensis ACAM 620]